MEYSSAPDTPPQDPRRNQPPTDDARVIEEEDAAAAEAARIGGDVGEDEDQDPAMRPVAEAGGGEAEGFERAEAELREQAEHGEGFRTPSRDAMPPEEESDRSAAAYGEGDRRDPPEPDLERESDRSSVD